MLCFKHKILHQRFSLTRPLGTAIFFSFDYSPSNKFFYKGLKEEDKKEGFLKRLKNIADKNEEQLKIIGSSNRIVSSAIIDTFGEW